jgi:DNA-binding MarR family transcriptional regulator
VYDSYVKKKPDAGPAFDPTLWTLIETANQLQQRLEDALKALGLSRAKGEVLHQLLQAGEPVPLRTLAEGKHCVPSNMTTLMDRLESDGLVRRVADPDDRRSVRAELTPLGVKRARLGMEAVEQVQREFNAALPAAERKALNKLLGRLRR